MHQDLNDLVIYDIGAFHGLLTLFFARQGKQVISYEPNTRNYRRLIENFRLNELKNVLVRKIGVGAKPGIATMVAPVPMFGRASVERDTVASLVNSNARLLFEQVSITTLDDDIREISLPAPDFVKIDVEGEELAVLVGARSTLLARHPLLFLEMHGATMSLKRRNVTAIVAYLNELGYSDIVHVESGARINADNSSIASEGHLYCR